MPLPGRVLIPVHGVFRDGHDVRLAIAVDIRDRYRIADITDVVVDFLGDEPGRLGLDVCDREPQRENCCPYRESHRSLPKSRVG